LGAIVRHIDEDGVFFESSILQERLQLAQVLVQIGDHSVELRRDRIAIVSTSIGVGIVIGHDVRNVRRIGGEIYEERLVRASLTIDPPHGFAKEDVGAITLEAFIHSIVRKHGIEVGVGMVFPMVGQGSNAPGPVMEGFVKPAILRSVRITVSQMPFTEVPGGVSGIGEKIGHGGKVGPHHGTALANGRATVAHGVEAGHELTPCG